MKENTFKIIFAAIIGGVSAYFRIMAIPIIMLVGVMIIDYASGMLKAWVGNSLSSRTGVIGIIKKVSYLLVICVSGVVDWLITSGLHNIGVNIDISFYFGLIVTIWFIINECISILENLAVLGVPLPSFLTAAVKKLKIAVENRSESKED